MNKTQISFKKVPQFSKTDVAYATGDQLLAPFYEYKVHPDSIPALVSNRANYQTPREDLVEVLKDQYKNLPENPFSNRQIDALRSDHSFTVVTAHQPALFLGPLYFVYKAISAINLAEDIQGRLSDNHRIIPVFVLGSEDHDLEELNHAKLFNKNLVWEPGLSGAVGPMDTKTLKPVLGQLQEILGDSENAQYLFSRIERAYTGQSSFGAATQALLHDLFGRYGLVVLNMNDPRLKRHFIPAMEEELLAGSSYNLVNESIKLLIEKGFKPQALPREINLFYLSEGGRNRIVKEGGSYQVLNSDLKFSTEEILRELREHPERFSPNVVMRPLYQETILPNLAYVGGGGELAYWLERKSHFQHFKLPFPMLVRRHSALWIEADGCKKMDKVGLKAEALFQDTDSIIRQFIETNADTEVSLEEEIAEQAQIFSRIAEKAKITDPTLEKAVRAEESRQANTLKQLEGRLVRAEKQKHEQSVNQIRKLRDRYFPNGGMQERSDNFIPFYLRYGEGFFDTLKESFMPFEEGLVMLEEK